MGYYRLAAARGEAGRRGLLVRGRRGGGGLAAVEAEGLEGLGWSGRRRGRGVAGGGVVAVIGGAGSGSEGAREGGLLRELVGDGVEEGFIDDALFEEILEFLEEGQV